ncbi:MAG: hypothetical protein WDO24_11650 [Pseudomonadota bacterium]
MSTARADDSPEPTVHAQLLLPTPAELVMAIEPRDDSDANLKLRDLMTARLVERHGRVVADAPRCCASPPPSRPAATARPPAKPASAVAAAAVAAAAATRPRMPPRRRTAAPAIA